MEQDGVGPLPQVEAKREHPRMTGERGITESCLLSQDRGNSWNRSETLSFNSGT